MTAARRKIKSAPEETVKIVTLTPQDCQELLARNTANYRGLNKRTVARYADSMRRGEWLFNHQGVAIDVNGVLLDGQHRLHAASEAGVSIRVVMAEGLNPQAKYTIDTPDMVRKCSDAIAHLGFGNHAAAIAACYTTAATYLSFRGKVAKYYRLRPDRMPDLVEAWPTPTQVATDLESLRSRGVGLWSAASFFIYCVGWDLETDAADEFAHGLVRGAELTEGHPVLALRNTMLNRRLNGKSMSRSWVLYAHIRAWNSMRMNKPLSLFKSDSSGVRIPELHVEPDGVKAIEALLGIPEHVE